MKKARLAFVAALVVAGTVTAQAQELKINALVIAWYHQALDSNLRLNPATPFPYYAFGGSKGAGSQEPMKENGFSIRRTEIYLNGKLNEQLSAGIILDPKDTNPIILDAAITWKPTSRIEVKVGQFKPLQTYEATSVGSPDLIFVDRSQYARRIGDIRDRGIVGAYTFGDKNLNLKASVGVFNGANRDNDANAQKDFVARLDLTAGLHKIGFYGLKGSTDVKDTTGLSIVPASLAAWGPDGPTRQQVYDNKDLTSSYGLYYYFTKGPWHVDAEVVTGVLGRRYPTLSATAPALKREHLDQRFLTYWVSGTYTVDRHIFSARVDLLNCNQGEDYYTATNPYLAIAGADYTPKFTEITVGYTHLLNPKLVRQANFKLNYIARSKNILAPRAGQTGEQGGDSLVAAFQVYF